MNRSGERVELPDLPGDLIDLQWAPGGGNLLALTTEAADTPAHDLPYRSTSSADWLASPTYRIWVIDPSGEPPGHLNLQGTHIGAMAWSPDGQHLAYLSDRGVDRDTSLASGLWLRDMDSEESSCLVSPTAPIHGLVWSPDSSRIAYIVSARDNSASALKELWVVDVMTLERRRLGPRLDRSIGQATRGDDERGIGTPNLEWASPSDHVLAIYADGGTSRLGSFGLDGSVEDMVGGHSVLEFSSSSAGVAYTWSNSHAPGELSWFDLAAEAHVDVTDLRNEHLADVELSDTISVSITASDGVGVEGWLTLPEVAKDAPLVLQVHGGPHYPVGERFSFDAERLAAQGVAVLRANPRGSLGYGQEFADGNLGDWGGRDLADLVELVEAAVKIADLNGNRVAVMGESYGGYIAAWAAGSTDRFTAAVVENGIADFLSSVGGSAGPTFWYSELGGAPWVNPSVYLERSAITRLDKVEAAVLVIHCEADATCPIAHGEAIYSGLRELGADVEFVRVPGEGHFFNVFGALTRRLDRTAALDEFLIKHLLPEPRATTSDIEEAAS